MTMQLLLAFLLAFVASATNVEDGVYVLGEDNFDSFIAENEHVLVEFYAPWCGHCKNLAPEYASAAQTLAQDGSAVKLAKVDATVHAALGQRFAIQGYPTLKFFRSGSPIEYEGGRKAAEILAWVLKKSGPASAELSSQDAITQLSEKDTTSIIAYVKPGAQFDTWLSVAKDAKFSDFLGGHVFDEALWGNNKEGTLVMHKKGEEPVVYSGEFESEAILKWLMAEGFPLVEELAQPIWMRSSQASAPLLAVFHEETDSATQELVHKVAKANKGSAFFSWSTRIQLLEQWGGSGKFVPSAIMILWVNGEPKFKIWNEENGVAFDEAGLNAFVKETLAGTYAAFKKSEPVPEDNSGPVVTIVGKNFDEVVYNKEGNPVFVEFYAPWCGHCKKLAPVWDELGTSIKKDLPNVVVGKIDATANTLPDEISITGFPTLVLFQGKQQTVYSGSRDVDGFTSFLKAQVQTKEAEHSEL